MRTDDYYQLLGVSRFVSPDALRHAFRSRLFVVHPDRNSGDALATEQTRNVVEAYRVLSDPRSRRNYDLSIATHIPATITPAASPISSVPRSAYKTATLVCFIVMALCVARLIGEAIAESHGPVFRAVLIAQPHQTNPRDFPVVPEPSIADTVEWYHAQAYQLSLGNNWTRHELVKVYSDAARQAARRGDRRRARFYLDSLSQAVDNGAEPLLPTNPT